MLAVIWPNFPFLVPISLRSFSSVAFSVGFGSLLWLTSSGVGTLPESSAIFINQCKFTNKCLQNSLPTANVNVSMVSSNRNDYQELDDSKLQYVNQTLRFCCMTQHFQ